MIKPSKTAATLAKLLTPDNSQMSTAPSGSKKAFNNTIAEVLKIDTEFEKSNGVFFEPGKDAFDTAKKFTDIHINHYHDNARPSLPTLAIHHAEKMGLSQGSPEYKAMVLIAFHAEIQQENAPDYHNRNHFADVTAVAASLIHTNLQMLEDKNPEAVNLNASEQALVVIAALGHDLGHDGHGNPADNIYFNEDKSFIQIAPILEEAGLDQKKINKIQTMLLTTSPNGPHSILKSTAKSFRENGGVNWKKVDPEGKYPELKHLSQDTALTEMCAILSDADLYASSGAGLESNKVMSNFLTNETKKSGVNMDFTSDNSRKFFLDNIVGTEGFASGAGRKNGNETFQALRSETDRRIASTAKPPAGPKQ